MSFNNEAISSGEQFNTLENKQTSVEKDDNQARVYKRFMGILPAFRHTSSGETHLSCEEDGTLAPVHRVDFLPSKWLLCNIDKSECKLKDSIEKGYVVMGHFFNQQDAAQLLPH
ncbi:MAG: hypothetical protein OQL19_22480 [Gammaproteobacteria bacterium]|nr:hypothetical protein [Gammaproteobacteria bacterium]